MFLSPIGSTNNVLRFRSVNPIVIIPSKIRRENKNSNAEILDKFPIKRINVILTQ